MNILAASAIALAKGVSFETIVQVVRKFKGIGRRFKHLGTQRVLMMAIALGGGERALAQSPIPELRFVDPPGFYRSAMYPPADFSSNEVNASLQVYPFRPVNGDVRQAFSRTLLRELVDPRYQETSVAPGARVDAFMMPGADIVLRARFSDLVAGQLHERMRMVLVVGTAVAILDATASSMAGWQRILPQLNAFSGTLQIVSGAPAPTLVAPPTSADRAVAGIYLGFANKYDVIRGQSVYAAFYFLLSVDGRVYRAYDELTVPGNDPAQFDFAGAQRADPVNSGQYILQGNSISMRFGSPQQPESLVARLAPGNALIIGNVRYERQ